MKYNILFYILLFSLPAIAQVEIAHVEPPNWYVGMKNTELQLLVHGKDIAKATVKLGNNLATLKETKKVSNPNYLFLTLSIDKNAKAGTLPITFTSGSQTKTISYELRAKSTDKNRIQGFDASDVIYLIMPDRFANAVPENDNVAGMLETASRDSLYGRHGGDLQGITNNLAYIKNLGMTAIWLNPVLENDMPQASYHGYAITDLYNVDKRFGGNKAYLDFIEKSHQAGLKVIQDMVANHIGLHHWLMKDLPEPTWIHQFGEFTRSNYHLETASDPHASEKDKMLMEKGWFDTTMPDVNQSNPLFAKYLIQNSLWWIEYGGIDGIRMDTYPYNDKQFMSDWATAILNEYPKFNLVGEIWIGSPAIEAYWASGTKNRDGFVSTLPSVTDFPLLDAAKAAFNEPTSWTGGLSKLYGTLATDFLYQNPLNNVIFLDNHDDTRFFTTVGEDLDKHKMAIAFLLTTRGTPQIYYGTEVLMTGGPEHAYLRRDFAGGWAGDKVNVFKNEGLTEKQKEASNYMSKLANWRKNKKVIHTGKLTHFIPENEMYVYFRHDAQEKVMVIIHTGNNAKKLDTKRFEELLKDINKGKEVITNKEFDNLKVIDVPAKSVMIIELMK
ncbi:MAG: alpha-amlyase [Cytophagales bacterium]|nr:MAG: alpha-amlyase [Cytophagales bacterium]